MKNIQKIILTFYKEVESDPNHRFKSWEHCYLYFGKDEIDIDKACLHLSFYLASWGMYRGSSPLLWKDYLIHEDAVREMLKNKNLRNFNGTDKEIDQIIKIRDFIYSYYKKNITKLDGTEYKPSDALITKIILGILGCTPAFDRYFKDGMSAINLSPKKFNKKALINIYQFYKENEKEFNNTQMRIRELSGIKYPSMKLVDMYLWQIGYSQSLK